MPTKCLGFSLLESLHMGLLGIFGTTPTYKHGMQLAAYWQILVSSIYIAARIPAWRTLEQ